MSQEQREQERELGRSGQRDAGPDHRGPPGRSYRLAFRAAVQQMVRTRSVVPDCSLSIAALLPASCEIVSRLLHSLHFPRLYNGDNSTYPEGCCD